MEGYGERWGALAHSGGKLERTSAAYCPRPRDFIQEVFNLLI